MQTSKIRGAFGPTTSALRRHLIITKMTRDVLGPSRGKKRDQLEGYMGVLRLWHSHNK